MATQSVNPQLSLPTNIFIIVFIFNFDDSDDSSGSVPVLMISNLEKICLSWPCVIQTIFFTIYVIYNMRIPVEEEII